MKDSTAKKWRCVECGFVHEGENPPEVCPICYAKKNAFIEVENG
jgi:rubrerythrin